ncbi:MAG: hypothetical protein QOI38_1350 [Sphingomonadales bacterium]|jgi:hypothetical protein|nr:hypothetical protein [Sphingomonadales bacterium]
MRKFLISAAVAAAATLTVAVPASAQYGRPNIQRPYNHNNVNRQAINELLRDLNRAESQIDRGVQRRTISQREAQGLRREAANIRMRLQRSGRDGINQREFAQLRQRVNHLEQRVRIERRDRDNRRW